MRGGERLDLDEAPDAGFGEVRTRTGRLWPLVRDDRRFRGLDPPSAAESSSRSIASGHGSPASPRESRASARLDGAPLVPLPWQKVRLEPPFRPDTGGRSLFLSSHRSRRSDADERPRTAGPPPAPPGRREVGGTGCYTVHALLAPGVGSGREEARLNEGADCPNLRCQAQRVAGWPDRGDEGVRRRLGQGKPSGAGRLLGLSPAAVSRAMAFLEQQVGAPLLHRTIQVTKEGSGPGRPSVSAEERAALIAGVSQLLLDILQKPLDATFVVIEASWRTGAGVG